MKTIDAYRDQYGIICQADGNGGDSANRTGLYEGAIAILGFAPKILHPPGIELTFSPGRYVRHPLQYDYPDMMSRDQQSPLENAWILSRNTSVLAQHLKLRAKRVLFHFNTFDKDEPGWHFPDPPSPLEIASLIRGVAPAFSFLLPMLDLFMVPVLLWPGDKNDGQIVLTMAVSRMLPSFVSKLVLRMNRGKLMAAIKNYHAEGPGRNGIEPLGELLVHALEAL